MIYVYQYPGGSKPDELKQIGWEGIPAFPTCLTVKKDPQVASLLVPGRVLTTLFESHVSGSFSTHPAVCSSLSVSDWRQECYKSSNNVILI